MKTVELLISIWNHTKELNTEDDQDGKMSHYLSSLMKYIVSVVYNLSTCSTGHQVMISQGVMRLICRELWPFIQQVDQEMCRSACLTVCHFAVGKTNSAQMVSEGCTTLLVFIGNNFQSMKNRCFDNYHVAACAAAMRNLACTYRNLPAMADEGGILCCVGIYRGTMQATTAEASSAKQDSLSALRSFTYHPDVQHELRSSDAIHLILADVERDMASNEVPIPFALICFALLRSSHCSCRLCTRFPAYLSIYLSVYLSIYLSFY
jgi:hypothetical protein